MDKKIILTLLVIVACSTGYEAKRDLLRVPLNGPVSPEPNNFCVGCRSMISFVSRFNESSARSDYKRLLTNFCELYYPVSTSFRQGPCPVFVESLYYLLDRVDPVNHCDQIGACGPIEEPQVLTPLQNENTVKEGDGIVCDVCEQAITQMQGFIEDPQIVETIKRQVDGFCEYLVVINQAKECRAMLDKYVDQAIDFIRQLKPLQYCQSIQLCSQNKISSTAVQNEQPNQQYPALISFQNFGIEHKVTIGDQVVKDLSAPERNMVYRGPNCMFCKVFVKEMFKFLRENRTEENIRYGLDKICSLVYPSKLSAKRKQCDDMVASYSKELIELLVDETNPELICTLLEQCVYQTTNYKTLTPTANVISSETPNTSVQIGNTEDEEPVEPIDMNLFISMLDSSIEQGSMKTCIECKMFIEYLRNTVEDPKSEDQIKEWLLKNLCSTLEEKRIFNSCRQLINNYAATFFKALVHELNPKEACIDLKACQAKRPRVFVIDNKPQQIDQSPMVTSPTASAVLKPTASIGSQLCDQCTAIVIKIDEYLSHNSIDHDVSVLIDQVCNKLGSDSAIAECTLLVKTFGQDIAQAISTMDSPQQLCSKIYLC